MTINEHVTTLNGLPVFSFDPEGELPEDSAAVAWRIEAEEFESPPEEFAARLEALVSRVPEGQIRALIIGEWGSAYDSGPPIDLLVSLAPRLSGLRALFLGEMTFEECEISWIHQGDVTPLLTAFPALEVLRVRGAEGLELQPVRHATLRELAFESGGLPGAVVRAVGASDLPVLRRLELWLGTSEYGADATVEDLGPILVGDRLPGLRHLALCDAEIADAVATAIATAPVVAQLDVLDLSMGVLSDEGATAMFAGQSLSVLERLDLHYHFLTPAMQERVTAALPEVEVDLSDAQTEEDPSSRYVAVAE